MPKISGIPPHLWCMHHQDPIMTPTYCSSPSQPKDLDDCSLSSSQGIDLKGFTFRWLHSDEDIVSSQSNSVGLVSSQTALQTNPSTFCNAGHKQHPLSQVVPSWNAGLRIPVCK
ncbi:hypothetical protein AMTRI_Chr11g155110 [Amborella trichopoda]